VFDSINILTSHTTIYRRLAMSETQGQPYAYSYPRTNAASQNTSDPAVRKQQAQHVASVTEDSSDVLYVLGMWMCTCLGMFMCWCMFMYIH
jgi:hypothetical protein